MITPAMAPPALLEPVGTTGWAVLLRAGQSPDLLTGRRHGSAALRCLGCPPGWLANPLAAPWGWLFKSRRTRPAPAAAWLLAVQPDGLSHPPIRVQVTSTTRVALQTWAEQWPGRQWAVEGATGLGRG